MEDSDSGEQYLNMYNSQLNQLTMLQHQTANYPSAENLEKVRLAAEGFKVILQCMLLHQQLAVGFESNGKG